jgi:colanic acid/amylovoran biosynthesis glycosyltransferase
MKVAYIVGVAPAGAGAFTADELGALAEVTNVERLAVMATDSITDWTSPGGRIAPRAWLALAKVMISSPRAIAKPVYELLRSSHSARDVLVAVRAALAAAYFSQHVTPDVIHAQFAGPAAATAFIWSKLVRLPYTVRAHAYDIYAGYGWVGKALRGSDTVVAISQDGQRHLWEAYGCHSTVIRVGIPGSTIERRPAAAPHRPFRFLSVGALTEKKGHDIAIEAVRRLSAMGISVSLDIYGSGPLSGHLSRLAESAPVRLCGSLPTQDIRARYQHYDALLMTSRIAADRDRDGIPVVIMEAMAASLPVTVTAVGGISELVIDGVTGTVLPHDSESMSVALRQFIDMYPEALDRTGAARQAVMESYDLAGNVAQLLEVWKRVIVARAE